MSNLPRRKGTGAETDLINWLRAHGAPGADRHALHGARDLGDVQGTPGLCWSVKFVGKGKPMNLSGWLNDLQVMRFNNDARLPVLDTGPPPGCDGVLVVRRVGYPDPGSWYAVQELGDWWGRYLQHM